MSVQQTGRMVGKRALITGAGSGIGAATAALFAAEGARVFLAGRTESKLVAMADKIREAGGQADLHAADLSSAEAVDDVFDAACDAMGQVDSVVNAAGIGYSWNEVSPGSMNDIATTPIDKYHEVVAINQDSVFFMCRRAIQHMREHKSGSIVNIASVYGLVGVYDCHTYSAVKAGIAHLTKSIAVRYAGSGIRANCIAPGFTATPMTESVMDRFQDKKSMSAVIPAARAGTPMEIAMGCLYLASDEASYTTGVVLPIDGGWTAK
ncbi:MAG: SDR family NAD(P)-dependent oxidoreductase [Pseudomonadota bacterium]